jgi:hypothetical protein
MAKAKRSDTKEKKRSYSREVVIGVIGIIVVLLVIALFVWLMMPGAGKRGVPRKSRLLQQSSLESPRICICSSAIWEASPSRRIKPPKGTLSFPFDRGSSVSFSQGPRPAVDFRVKINVPLSRINGSVVV